MIAHQRTPVVINTRSNRRVDSKWTCGPALNLFGDATGPVTEIGG